MAYFRRDQYPGDYRFHFLVRYRYPKRYATDQHYTHLRGEGMGLRESVIQGSLDRLNPILMTALSSALAFDPLALNGDLPGNEIQSPMRR